MPLRGSPKGPIGGPPRGEGGEGGTPKGTKTCVLVETLGSEMEQNDLLDLWGRGGTSKTRVFVTFGHFRLPLAVYTRYQTCRTRFPQRGPLKGPTRDPPQRGPSKGSFRTLQGPSAYATSRPSCVGQAPCPRLSSTLSDSINRTMEVLHLCRASALSRRGIVPLSVDS